MMISKTTVGLLFSFLGLVSAGSIITKPRDSITIPPECDVIPPWVVTDFYWFNSSNNLDCVTEANVPNVCINSTDSGLVSCDSALTPCDECGIYGCDTGLPLQPAGYGPPDNITLAITSVFEYGGCFESNPQGIRRHEVGDGIVLCGGVAFYINFEGDSSQDVGTGHIDFAPIGVWDCTNGSTISASGSVDFDIVCTRDAQNNATCLIPANETVIVPITSYTIDLVD